MRYPKYQHKSASSRPLCPGRVRILMLVFLCLVHPACWANQPYPLFGPPLVDTTVATYQAAPGELAPQNYAGLPAWLASHTRLSTVSMLGGDYWLVTRLTPSLPHPGQLSPDGPTFDWVVTFNNTYYKHATIAVLGDDDSRWQFEAGHNIDANFLLHGAAEVTLAPNHQYAVVIHVTTPFFTALPRIDVQTHAQYRQRAMNESALVLGSLGLLCGLGIFILFVGIWIRDRRYALYGCQALILVFGWSFFFGVPQGWLRIDTGRVNFTQWFIVLPIVHAWFTIRFLDLRRHAPRLARVGDAIAIASAVALLPSLIFPSLAFLIATLAVAIVVLFSASSGVWALLRGVRQARFFTLAFVAVLVPGLIILPVNFGLVPSIVDNADLLTLIGNGCEAMLLAFALADHVKLVEDGRERYRLGMQEAIAKASIDPLTDLGNRLAFNVMIEEITRRTNPNPIQGTWQIAMIDLDGLKQVNDTLGHEYGDELLQATGAGLTRLGDHTRAFRLGGDEFAVISYGDDLSQQRLTRALADLDRTLRETGFPDAGVSFGVCSAPITNKRDFTGLVREADRIMYAYKYRRRGERASDQPLSEGRGVRNEE